MIKSCHLVKLAFDFPRMPFGDSLHPIEINKFEYSAVMIVVVVDAEEGVF